MIDTVSHCITLYTKNKVFLISYFDDFDTGPYYATQTSVKLIM